jgi:hypothetical protein
MKFRKKPVVIEAHYYDGDYREAIEWARNVTDGNGTCLAYSPVTSTMVVCTLEGEMNVPIGNFIICGVEGELYSCEPNIFSKDI